MTNDERASAGGSVRLRASGFGFQYSDFFRHSCLGIRHSYGWVMQLERVTLFCFEASYTVAFALELLQLIRPRAAQRWIGLGFGAAGLLAHTLFLLHHQLPLSSPFGSILFLAWILAVFYFYGSLHHRRVAWGVFVLPVVLGLIGLADQNRIPLEGGRGAGFYLDALRGERFWGLVHGALLL